MLNDYTSLRRSYRWRHSSALALSILLCFALYFAYVGHSSSPARPRSPFELDRAVWGDGGPKPIGQPLDFPFPKTRPPPPLSLFGAAAKVPNVVHHIMLARPDGKTDMEYYQYLSIRSAMIVQQPEVMYFHYDIVPTGPWFQLLRPHLTLNQLTAPTKIWNHELNLAAHKSDIIRIYALKALGGIYLDFDMFLLRSMRDLMDEPFTMGLESPGLDKMGNAVILSEPNAAFLDKWLVGYQDFRQMYEYNSVIKSLHIARANPSDVRLLNSTAFFTPHFKRNAEVFEGTDFDFDAHEGYAYHAWNSLSARWLKGLSPATVLSVETSFHRLLRRFMGENDLVVAAGSAEQADSLRTP